MFGLFDPIRNLNGIGETRAKLLHGMNIDTVYDLISHFPRTYEDRSRVVSISELIAGEASCFIAMVVSKPQLSHIRKGLDIIKVRVADDTSSLNLVFFNQSYIKDFLIYGERYVFYGTVNCDYIGLQMTNPIVERVDVAGIATRCIMPIYNLTAGINNKFLCRSVAQALAGCKNSLIEVLPKQQRDQYGLCDIYTAYNSIHNPPSLEMLENARHRLIFEEFFVFFAGLAIMRQRNLRKTCKPIEKISLQPFYNALPFELTNAQNRTISEIKEDMCKPTAMARLVQGDVGCGKTIVAAAAIYLVAKNGVQCAMMAPTEILAQQHFQKLKRLFEPFGIHVALITGSMKTAERRNVMDALSSGSVDVVVGTHAILSDTIQFQSLGLVIADEQHRFGVSQRTQLLKKGNHPHLLVMSATPIPRTLALILYGELDVSIIDETPPGRDVVDTFLVGEGMRSRINDFIRKQALAGHQTYIVCPTVEENEEIDSLKSAQVWAETLQTTVFPDLRVSLLHGKMTGTEKDAVMNAFAKGECDILVATTVVEVGMDVPNATLIVIENADRFGLSQLHQLRGRVGRGEDKSYCILISSNTNTDTINRLKQFCKTNDGFKIAEEDLSIRGPGDFFGTRQHGFPTFKVANLNIDISVMSQAKEAAEHLIAQKNINELPEYQALVQRINILFSQDVNILN